LPFCLSTRRFGGGRLRFGSRDRFGGLGLPGLARRWRGFHEPLDGKPGQLVIAFAVFVAAEVRIRQFADYGNRLAAVKTGHGANDALG
jgi:hypothetical protein